MKVLAYAKLNLALRVVGRREDGLHAIESFVQTVDLADRLTVERREEGVTVENSLALPPGEDLAARAATLLLREKGDPCGAEITVEKRIPAGAGLGGGSSDAAAVLAALDRLTPPRLPRTRLADLARRLGADVSLFLTGGRLRMEGAGERVTGLPFGGERAVRRPGAAGALRDLPRLRALRPAHPQTCRSSRGRSSWERTTSSRRRWSSTRTSSPTGAAVRALGARLHSE